MPGNLSPISPLSTNFYLQPSPVMASPAERQSRRLTYALPRSLQILLQHLPVRQVCRPAVGVGHRRVEAGVDVIQPRHPATSAAGRADSSRKQPPQRQEETRTSPGQSRPSLADAAPDQRNRHKGDCQDYDAGDWDKRPYPICKVFVRDNLTYLAHHPAPSLANHRDLLPAHQSVAGNQLERTRDSFQPKTGLLPTRRKTKMLACL